MINSENWSTDDMVEVRLSENTTFHIVAETLTRMGIGSKNHYKLYQTCYLLHKQGKYYIAHFKEMYALDGKCKELSEEDLGRRNLIIEYLEKWKIIEVINKEKVERKLTKDNLLVLSFKESKNWKLIPKYTIGNRK